ncbi:hypothetical protein [Amycolatopsis sp. lyj-84]|uniref:hypothetical protein n=1 Tax=Amycolatopsis sp. lyj-84 TaxID=2789284 RepID=UPI00397A87CE
MESRDAFERRMWRLWSDRPFPDTSRAGGWMRWVRVTRGQTADEVAFVSNMSVKLLYELERGHKRLDSVEKALSLAYALNQDPLRFMHRVVTDILADREIDLPEVGESVHG